MVASRVFGITWCLWTLALRAFVPKKLGSLVAEVGRGEAGGEESVATLPVEWVVDIADKDSDWFIATAYAYNGELSELNSRASLSKRYDSSDTKGRHAFVHPSLVGLIHVIVDFLVLGPAVCRSLIPGTR